MSGMNIEVKPKPKVYKPIPSLTGALISTESILVDEKHAPFAWVMKTFKEYLYSDPEMAAAVAAVSALTEVIKVSKANTMMELEIELKLAADLLKESSSALSVSSGVELFTRFVTRTSLDFPVFVECKRKLIEKGEQYTKQSAASRSKIAQLAEGFIRDNSVVLTHGFSRCVLGVFLRAVSQGKRFSVIVTEARPDNVGYETAKRLREANVPVTLVMDASVGRIMEKVDLVLVGAEAIAESGGIINKIGTYPLSIVAKELNKPFYVAAESFKFTRMYPLNQRDLKPLKYNPKFHFCKECSSEDIETLKPIEVENLLQDYTPPSYITLLFTELGVLTPAAVSDELIRLYY